MKIQFCEDFKLLFKEVFDIELKDEENFTLKDLKEKYPIKDIIFERNNKYDFEFKGLSKTFKMIDWEFVDNVATQLLYKSYFRISFIKINKKGNKISPIIFHWYINDFHLIEKENLNELFKIIFNPYKINKEYEHF